MRFLFRAAVALAVVAIALLGGLAVLYSVLGIPFPLAVLLATGALGFSVAAVPTVRGLRRLRRTARRRAGTPARRKTAAPSFTARRPLIKSALLIID